MHSDNSVNFLHTSCILYVCDLFHICCHFNKFMDPWNICMYARTYICFRDFTVTQQKWDPAPNLSAVFY
jgi:hypothetical protein